MLVPTNKSKEKIKNMKSYGVNLEKLPLDKAIEFPSMTMIIFLK